jgi:dihydrofolate reductase
MAKIVSTLFISLDGVIEPDENWHFPYFDEAMGAAVTDDYATADTLLLGRVTYDSFAGAWPDRETEGGEDAAFAKIIGDMRKVVASRQRLDLGWRNVEQIEGDLVSAARALRDDPSVKGILVPGSVSVVRQLMAAGLLDELRLLVHPVAVRGGTRLFDDGDSSYHLRLVKSEALPTGVLRLIYAPRG